ncbi:MAG: hypothetical protein Q3M30_16050 [Candidatus Electrothrix sp. Rat3]|nr:hypothetical protein [Candidatus Electrothrix rattekaaiensis]
MLQFKKISVNLALVVSLAAFASAQYAHAQTENIKLPLPIDELEIQAAVQGVIVGTDLNEIRRQTRDTVMVEQVKRLPLLQQIRNTLGNTVRTRVMAETSTRAINAQMNAMQDPMNPDGVPMFLAPKFE